MTRRDRPSTRYEIVVGRSLAICAHPIAAWRTTSKKRMVLCAGYFAAGYLMVFTLMSFWR
jgi:hypothetical protein